MKRAKGATLLEIMKGTSRGFVSILGSKQREKIESSKNAAF
jgi:transcriptional regulator